MKIVHVFKTFWPDTFGGVERVIDGLCKTAIASGDQCEVVTLSSNPVPHGFDFNGYKVFSHTKHIDIASTPMSLTAWSFFKKRIQDADIVHYHFPWPYMDLLHLAIRPKCKVVVTYHSDVVKQRKLHQLYKPLQRWFLEQADEIYVTSPNYLETSDELTEFHDKILIRPIKINESDYPKSEKTEKIDALNLNYNEYFVFIGVLRYYKGLDVLLQSAKGTDLQVVIAGSGPEDTRLHNLASELKLDNVVFAGTVSDAEKMTLLQNCRAFVFPSNQRAEAFGVSLLEASMAGKAMITCEIGTGTSYVNMHGETGFVVPANDPDALKEALFTLANDPALAATLGQNARQRFETLFSAC